MEDCSVFSCELFSKSYDSLEILGYSLHNVMFHLQAVMLVARICIKLSDCFSLQKLLITILIKMDSYCTDQEILYFKGGIVSKLNQ